MSIRLLKTLVAIAEHKTFGAAADAVFITHAAVSQQMKALEETLQIAIFDRTSRTPELTPVGLQLVEKAKKLIEDYDNLVPSIFGEEVFNSEFILGVVPTSLLALTPKTVSVLRNKHPNLRIRIEPSLTTKLISGIERNKFDAAIVSKSDILPKDVVFVPIADEPLELITPLSNTQTDPKEILQTNPYIRFNRDAVVGAIIDTWLSDEKISINEVMELQSLEAIASMVNSELGVSIVPKSCVPSPFKIPVRSLEFSDAKLKRTLGLAYRKSHPKLIVIQEIIAAMSSVSSQAGP